MGSSRPKVLVAMSGGVDSSVAAAMLVRSGYDVVGCFMRLGSPGESLDQLEPVDDAASRCTQPSGRPHSGSVPLPIAQSPLPPVKIGHQGCCSITDAADARLVAAHLGIPLYVCNFKKDFGRIVDYFVDEYAAGRTPNPCVRCNDWLKFGKLHDYARQLGAQFVASGHYARIEPGPAGPRLLTGLDPDKDQSYVLFGAPRARLADMMFPIGHLPKSRVRDLAREFGLNVFDKPDSQEICFVPDNDYAGLVERRRPDLARRGDILDQSGHVVGAHAGQHRFTIGQRRGVGVALGYPIFVVGKDPASNTVTVGPRERLAATACAAGEANWLVDPPGPGAALPCLAKYRSNSDPVPAHVRVTPDASTPTPSGRTGTFHVTFDAPQFAVAPGQAVVLYDRAEPQVVLGGGWITTTTTTNTTTTTASASATPQEPSA
jgi:tRNA-specific 2-thiouridylase